MGATIYDVATLAGVSIATVSRVLNVPQTVNQITLQRVQAAIDALGFVPKAEARARARRSNRQVGVVAPFFTHAAFVQRLRGIASALAEAGLELVVYNADSPEHIQGILFSAALTRRLDGLIVISLVVADEAVKRLQAHELPVVLIEAVHPGVSGVTVDNYAGGRLAAETLLGAGHRRIGFVGGDFVIGDYTLRTSRDRLCGFTDCLAEAGLTPLLGEMPEGSATPADAQRQTHQLLARDPAPTAIFAASDILALGVMRAAQESGVRIPGALAVLGFDDLEVAEYVGLTTISQSLELSGQQAVELLLSHMADSNLPLRRVQLPLRVIQRDTLCI